MNETTSAQRHELSDFLRTRRARISPSDVGLLNGSRRRTPGLRREEVALLANIGVTWYTRLEQGAPINVSTDVLASIARALQLTEYEREHLFMLAGQRPAEPTVAETERVSPLLQRVLDSLEPCPATVRGRRCALRRLRIHGSPSSQRVMALLHGSALPHDLSEMG